MLCAVGPGKPVPPHFLVLVFARPGWSVSPVALPKNRHGPVRRKLRAISMPIFYLNVGTVSRGDGRSVVGAAAYCSGSKLQDARIGRDFDCKGKVDLVHSEILLPEGASQRWLDREVFWNEVEMVEERKDAQLAREIELVVPGALSLDDGVSLVREFMLEQFVARGMVVDLNVHRATGADGRMKSYGHGLCSLRAIAGDGFGKKQREWNSRKILVGWRKRWAALANQYLLEAGQKELIDARAGAESGRALDLRPAGAPGRGAEDAEIACRNGERIVAEPGLVLVELTRERPSFTRQELERFVEANSVGTEQFARALARVESSIELVRLRDGANGEESFSRRSVGSIAAPRESCRTVPAGESEGERVSVVSLREAVVGWETAGLKVRGVGLTYEKAKAFEKTWGIKSVAVHGLLGRWMKRQDQLEPNDVLVVNDVKRLSQKQKDWMLAASRAVKAKLVLVDEVGFTTIEGGDVGMNAAQLAAFGGGGR